ATDISVVNELDFAVEAGIVIWRRPPNTFQIVDDLHHVDKTVLLLRYIPVQSLACARGMHDAECYDNLEGKEKAKMWTFSGLLKTSGGSLPLLILINADQFKTTTLLTSRPILD